jgi:arylsulfatase
MFIFILVSIAFLWAFFQIGVLISVSNSNFQNEESINNEFVLDNDDADVPNVDVASKKTKEKAKGGTHLGEEVLVGKKDSRDLESKDDGDGKDDDGDSKAKSKKEKMNIVLFYADDWRFDSIGALNPIVHTPSLNKLAKEGVIFTQNAVTTSICWISRACLATGQHYSRHKTLDIGDPVPFHQHWNDTLFGKLRDHGYFTGAVGKWQPGALQPYMFNSSESYYGFHFQENGDHITDMNERDALDFLRNKRKKNVDDPFALFVNFFAPHHYDGQPEQYFPQNKTQYLYKDIEIPFAPTCTQEAWENLPPFFTDTNEGRSRWRDRFNEKSKAQKMIKNYLRLISGVDMTIGNILQELERQNLTDNTLVIFTTDNGYYHAEHGLADKFYAHQESIRVPLIIRDPRMNKDQIGTRNEELTLSIDLAPTMLQAAEINVPDRMQGVDMSLLYRAAKDTDTDTDTDTAKQKTETAWRRNFYYEYPGIPGNMGHIPVQALVRRDFKYIYWPTHKYEELFHLPSDPYEEHDLARNATFEVTMQELRSEFKKVQADAQ